MANPLILIKANVFCCLFNSNLTFDLVRYLCDYTYYTSLYLGKGRSAFVHVPPLEKPYSAQDLGRALQAVVGEMLELVGQSEDDDHDHHHCSHQHHQHAH